MKKMKKFEESIEDIYLDISGKLVEIARIKQSQWDAEDRLLDLIVSIIDNYIFEPELIYKIESNRKYIKLLEQHKNGIIMDIDKVKLIFIDICKEVGIKKLKEFDIK